MKYGADYSIKCETEFTNIPDPDSGSKFLQEIYSLLWDDSNLQECKDGNVITGETMNSSNTTLCALYEHLEAPQYNR